MSSSEIKPLKETGEHSYHRRAFSHDYYAPFIYHIIFKKAPNCKSFGFVDGDARIAPGKTGCACIKESDLGKIIAKSILHFPHQYPVIKLHQFCVMPDHVHMLLQVMFRSEKHLDTYMDILKDMITLKYSRSEGKTINREEIFERGYCDKPLYDNRSLDSLYTYIRENPHRLAMRVQYPRFFQRCRKLLIAGMEYEAYGNLFLLRNPDKTTVKVASKATDAEKARQKNVAATLAKQGTVFVSPFISRAEKDIRTIAEKNGAKIILITHEVFGERFKPAKHDFDLCCNGHLLIISLGLPSKSPLTRTICLQMNALAQTITTITR